MYLVLVPVGIWFVLRYAKKVKADPARSMVGPPTGDEEMAHPRAGRGPRRSTAQAEGRAGGRGVHVRLHDLHHRPWAQVINGPTPTSYTWQFDWYFPELAALFLVMSLVVGLIGGMGEKKLTDTLVRGAGDFIGVGLIIVLARGITVIMNNSLITDTVLHSMEDAVSNTSAGVFGALMFLRQPAAGVPGAVHLRARALAMPILAPLADFAGVSRAMVVTAYQSASASSTWSRRPRRWSWEAWRWPRSATTSTSGSSGRCC